MNYPPARTVSFVVCSHTLERWPQLIAAIDSLQAQTFAIDEIILVVDHNDLLRERALREFVDVTVLENVGRRGLSGARNTGARRASSDVVAFLDDDAEAAPDCAQRIMAAYADRDVIAVGGCVVPRFERERPLWFPPEFDWVFGCTYSGHRESRGPLRNMIGAVMSLRRTAFDVTDGFRSDLGRTSSSAAGCEETELCIRMAEACSGVVWYEPSAIAVHNVPASRTTLRYLRRRCLDEGRSKALIARMVGSQRGLATERRYVMRTLPAALMSSLARAVVMRPGALRRALAVLVGLFFTALGYVIGSVQSRRAAEQSESELVPIFVTRLDVDAVTSIAPSPGPRGRYRRARILACRGHRPIDVLEVDLPAGGLNAGSVDRLIAPVRHRDDESNPEPARGCDRSPFVSVIVATRDREIELQRCLGSVLGLDYPSFEVVVVDNGSVRLATAEVVATVARNDQRVRYVREERTGLARAHNRGLQEASGTIVAFTDDDVVVEPGWLSAIVAAFGDDASVGCVTGMIVPSELETLSQWWTETWLGLNKGFSPRRFDARAPRRRDSLLPYAAGSLGSGANMAFRAEVLRALRGFDPALGVGTPARGGDDLAAFLAVALAGYDVVYEPEAMVHHTHRSDRAGLDAQAYGYGVGLGAYLAHLTTRYPSHLREIAARAPAAAFHLLSARSARNVRRSPGFPRTLIWRERVGVAVGPWRYVQSRRRVRHDEWRFAAPDLPAHSTTASGAIR